MIALRTAEQTAALAVAAIVIAGCSVRLQAPEEPIRFDVNVNITEQKRLEIDQELLALIRQNPSLFGLEEEDLPPAPTQDEEQ